MSLADRKVVIVGGGISGLAAAVTLERAGYEVHVIEAAAQPGGVIRTTREAGFVFEAGASSFPSSAKALIALAESVGAGGDIVTANPAAAKRLIYFKQKLRTVPMTPREFWRTPILSRRQKIRALLERFKPARRTGEPETVAEFFHRRFGLGPTVTLVDAFVSGIYAGDARRLDLDSAFPMMREMEREHGSIMKAMAVRARQNGGAPKIQSFRGGMQTLIEALAASLSRPVRTGTRVRNVGKIEGGGWRLAVEGVSGIELVEAPRIILAVPADVASALLAPIEPYVEDLLGEVEYAGVVVIHAAFDAEELRRLPQAFGYLVPRPQRMRTLGWLFSSRIFADRAPEGKVALTGYIGGATDPHILDAGEEALRYLVLGELSVALRMRHVPRPDLFRTVEHRPGIPQYAIGHRRRIAAVQELLKAHPGLDLIGAYWGGVSVNDCILSAQAAVRGILHGAPEPAPADGATT
jgi:protoporphyrinogen/coproporphyrinogen III oxidase